MRRAVLAGAVAAGIAGSAVAQDAPAPEPQGGPVTCGEFASMDSVGQLAALSAIEPLGGEIDAQDVDAAEQWAKSVGAACADDTGKPLAEAAREALGGD